VFTGIIEETGVVENVRRNASGIQLIVRAKLCGSDAKVGDSVAVNGCCLTVTKVRRNHGRTLLHFDLLRETWVRTNLQFVNASTLVNLERSLPARGRVAGHFVTGHVDGVGRIHRWERAGTDHVLDITAPRCVLDYVVTKGSVAVDGISLTVAEVTGKRFRLWIIPHTWNATSLRERQVGDMVNLEADILGKYVKAFLGKSGDNATISRSRLRKLAET
jgi:riboflavin synthase